MCFLQRGGKADTRDVEVSEDSMTKEITEGGVEKEKNSDKLEDLYIVIVEDTEYKLKTLLGVLSHPWLSPECLAVAGYNLCRLYLNFSKTINLFISLSR